MVLHKAEESSVLFHVKRFPNRFEVFFPYFDKPFLVSLSNRSHISFFSASYVRLESNKLLLTVLCPHDSRFARGVLLPGAPRPRLFN